MAFTARPQLRCSWGWVPTLRSISSTSPVSAMMPATMPRWSISCTSIRGASAVLSMLHKIPHPPSVPAECGVNRFHGGYNRYMEIVKSPAEQRVVLHNVSWETYGRLLAEHANSSAPRFAYDRGELEIMSPNPEHERTNR